METKDEGEEAAAAEGEEAGPISHHFGAWAMPTFVALNVDRGDVMGAMAKVATFFDMVVSPPRLRVGAE